MDSPGLTIFRQDAIVVEALPVRGVGWVLKWAGTLAVLFLALMILAGFAFQLAAERTLANAAAAGLREAALPRATSESMAAVVRQQLVRGGISARVATLRLEQNGQPLRGVVRPASGDQFAISLSVPARAILPRWLPMQVWLSSGVVQWHAKRTAN